MAKDDVETRFAEAVEAGRLFERGESVLAAVSGGPDSVALLHLLCILHRQGGIAQPHVAHLNHRLRGEASDGDAAFVEHLAEDLGLPRTIESADVRQRAEADSVSIEQAARQCRFAFFERLCVRLGISKVALAHHGDDNAETVLHRIIRGTGLRERVMSAAVCSRSAFALPTVPLR